MDTAVDVVMEKDPSLVKPIQVRVNGLNKIFKRNRESVHVLHDIDLEIEKGELLVLLGPSGCGKSTFLRCLVGLEKPTTGTIELDGKEVFDAKRKTFIQPNRRDVAMVFQNYALWPHMKVSKNIAYPLQARGLRDELNNGRVAEVLRIVQCEHLADRYPPELSGGQQQRVSLARAFAPKPALLLLDEPLSNLDALLRIELRAQLRRLHKELGFTAVHVTHDQEEALAIATRVAVMREGRIEQLGKPQDVYKSPSTEYVADFLGARNRLEMRTSKDGPTLIAETPINGLETPQLSGNYSLRWRDTDLKLRNEDTQRDNAYYWIPNAEVIEVLPAGDSAEHVVRIAGERLFIRTPIDAALGHGTRAEIGFRPNHTLCYDETGALVTNWASGR